ncbi:MAG TPA: signal peptidase II, partial [Actinomycetota bacterium]
NLTDRLTRGERFDGHVVDFIDLQIWPVFNLADTAIVIGAVVLAVASFLGDHAPREPDPAPPDPAPPEPAMPDLAMPDPAGHDPSTARDR